MAKRGADGKIIIDTEIDKSGIKHDARDIERELAGMGKTISKDSSRYTNEMAKNYQYYGRSVRRVYRGQSEEARRMHSEMRQAYMEQRVSLYKYKDQLIASKYAFFQLGKSAKNFSGSSKQFMSQVEAQGRVHKKVMDDMIKNNEMMKNQLIQSVGTIIVRTTQATRISENFARMKNPMYQVNKGALAIADGLNQIAMRGQPAVLALKMLGPTANMKQLQDMTMMIGQGIMRVTMVALAATVTAAKFYSTLHKGAMESNKAYATAFASMKKSIREAFEPLFQVFAAVMVPTFNFIKRLADMIVKFNEAHPKIAKFVAAILMLIPALTLLLSPLAIGIGLIAGFQAALGAAWMIIGPFITGMAAMSGTVLLVAAAITGVVVAFRHFNKEGKPLNDLLKNIGGSFKAVGGIIKAFFSGNTSDISKFSKQLHNMLPKSIADGIFNSLIFILQGIEKVKMGVIGFTKVVTGSFKSVADLDKYFQGVFGAEGTARIMKFGTAVRNSLISTMQMFEMIGQKAMQSGVVVGGMIKAFFTNNTKEIANLNKQLHNIFPPSIADGIFNSLITVLQGIDKLRMGIVAIAKVATGSFSSIADLDKYLQGAFGGKGTALILKFGNILKTVFSTISSYVGDFINKLQKFASAVATAFSGGGFDALINAVADLLPTIIGLLLGGIPQLIMVGSQLIQSLAKGMGTTVPGLITMVFDVITNLITSFAAQAPKMVAIGVDIITKLVNGIVTALPMVLAVVTKLIDVWLSTVTTLLPIIIQSGVQIIMAWINGIATMLPALLDAAIQIVMALVDGIVSMLPTLIESAISIIMMLVNTLIQNLPKILDAGIQILMALINGIIQILPVLLQAIIKIIMALLNTIVTNLPKIIDAGVKILMALIQGIIKILPQLITAALKLIITLVGALIKNLPKILDAGRKILLALLKGLASLAWELIKLGGKLIMDFVSGVGSKISNVVNKAKELKDKLLEKIKSIDLVEIGKNIIEGLIKGIGSMAKQVKEKVGEIVDGIKKKITGALSIKSPSRWMRDNVGKFIPQGIAVGIEADSQVAMKAVDGLTASLMPDMRRAMMPDMTKIRKPDVSGFANLATPSNPAPGPSETNNDQSVSVTFTGNIIVRNDDDIRRIGNELGSQINRDRRRLDR